MCNHSRKISIIINNFNYAKYLARCIESALNQTWSNTEVIVVDDGSTDESVKIAHRYESRITVIAKANGGQGSCYNVGFAASTGDIVCFLDADDMLSMDACAAVAGLQWDGIAKAQIYLELVDSEDKPAGVVIPFGVRAGDYASTFRRFGTYVSPPGSGNFYNRHFLESALPMSAWRWRTAADACLIYKAPGWGNVAIVPGRPLGNYRVHGRNASALAVEASGLRDGLRRYVLHEMWIERRRLSVVCSVLSATCGQYAVHAAPSLIKHRAIVLLLNRRRVNRLRISIAIICQASYVLIKWRHYQIKKMIMFYLWVLCCTFASEGTALRLAGATVYGYKRGF